MTLTDLIQRQAALIEKLAQPQPPVVIHDDRSSAASTPVATREPLPGLIEEAIRHRIKDIALRAQVTDWARRELVAGAEPSALAEQIWHGTASVA
jgi:hypothetical protein